jgi:hypothetical protein
LMMNEWIPAKLLLTKRHQSGRRNGWSFTYFFILVFGVPLQPKKMCQGQLLTPTMCFFFGGQFCDLAKVAIIHAKI